MTAPADQISDTQAVLAVEAALSEGQRAELMAVVLAANPRLHGAHVADVLAIGLDADDALSWTEPAWEWLPDSWPELGGRDYRRLMAAAVLAAAYLARDIPSASACERIFLAAKGALKPAE